MKKWKAKVAWREKLSMTPDVTTQYVSLTLRAAREEKVIKANRERVSGDKKKWWKGEKNYIIHKHTHTYTQTHKHTMKEKNKSTLHQ